MNKNVNPYLDTDIDELKSCCHRLHAEFSAIFILSTFVSTFSFIKILSGSLTATGFILCMLLISVHNMIAMRIMKNMQIDIKWIESAIKTKENKNN